MVPASQYRALAAALATVQVNAQAVAAADLTLGTITTATEKYSDWSVDDARRWARQQLEDAAGDVARFRGPFVGMPGAFVNAAQWDDLAHAIGRAYNVLWNILDVIGSDSEWSTFVGWLGDTIAGTIEALPGVIQQAVHFTAGVATDTVGGVAAGLLPLWPIVVVVGVIAVLGSIALAAGRKRGLVA